MEFIQAIALAVLQGLTEFLPISSSAHLVLLPLLANWQDQGLAFDVAVHVGTLIAVLAYFALDVLLLVRDGIRGLWLGQHVGQSRLAWLIVVATVPAGLAGLAVNALAQDMLRSGLVIAIANLVFAVALGLADRFGSHRRSVHSVTLLDALVIGCAQAFALIPGASRPGVTMTAALVLGLTRRAAARFSFLMAVPVIALAGALKGYEAFTDRMPVDVGTLTVGVVVSAACALACIHAFMALVERVGMLPFVIYRLLLGVLLLAFFAM